MLRVYSGAIAFCVLISGVSLLPAQAQDSGLYEPLVDEDAKGFKPAKYEKDLAYCRKRAAPHGDKAAAHAQAAREGAQQTAAGAALATAGSVLGGLLVPGVSAANGLFAGSSAAGAMGDAISAGGAAKQAQAGAAAGSAASDYQLVIDNCLIKRGYRFLR